MPRGFTFEASFGGVRIDVISTDAQHGREVPQHTYPGRDGADLEDMGRSPLVITLEVVFIDTPRDAREGTGDYQERFDAFDELVDSGEVRTLIHPYLGEVRGKISEFSHRADAESLAIFASFTFAEEISARPVISAGAGAPIRASSYEVRSAASQANTALADLGAESDLPDAISDEVARWESDPTLSPREIQLQMGSLNEQLSNELDAIDVASNLALYPILRAYTKLQNQLRRAAESFTSVSTRIVEITVAEPLPLRIVAARFYGAQAAETRFAEMLTLNPGVKNVTIIPAGTVLKAFSPSTPKPAVNA